MRTEKNEITQAVTQLVSPQRLEDLLKSFIQDQDVRPTSKSNYERILRQDFKWVNIHCDGFSDLTRIEILNYKDYLFKSGMSSLSVSSSLPDIDFS